MFAGLLLKLTGRIPHLNLPSNSLYRAIVVKHNLCTYDSSTGTFDASLRPPKGPSSHAQLGCVSLSSIIFHFFPWGILHPDLAQKFLGLISYDLREEVFLHRSSIRRILNQGRKGHNKMSSFGAIPNCFLPERETQGGLLDWLGATRIPGGFLSQCQRTSPGALEAPFLSTTASSNPTPHWSWTLPFHGQLAILSIM